MKIFRPFFCYCSNSIAKTEKIINIKIVSICSSNESSLIWSYTSTIYRLIIEPHNYQLPGGLIAQLVEHCIVIKDVRVRVPLRPFLHYCLLSLAKTAEIVNINRCNSVMVNISVLSHSGGAVVSTLSTIAIHRPNIICRLSSLVVIFALNSNLVLPSLLCIFISIFILRAFLYLCRLWWLRSYSWGTFSWLDCRQVWLDCSILPDGGHISDWFSYDA